MLVLLLLLLYAVPRLIRRRQRLLDLACTWLDGMTTTYCARKLQNPYLRRMEPHGCGMHKFITYIMLLSYDR